MMSTLYSYRSADEVPDDVADCWIGGVLYHRCGAGRKNQRLHPLPSCGQLFPHAPPHYHRNAGYEPNAAGERMAITCAACKNANRGTHKLRYQASTPRDRAIVPSQVRSITVQGREFTVGLHKDAQYWPVKPFVEAAGLSRQGQEERIKNDSVLSEGSKVFLLPTPGGAQPMLCLPWAKWHYFWTGTHSPKAERFRREAAEALALVFGDTAGEVLRPQPVAERVAARAVQMPSLPMSEIMRKHPALFVQYAELVRQAEEQAQRRQQVKIDSALRLQRAQERRAEAQRLLAAAIEEERSASDDDARAEIALSQANAQVEALLAQIDALSDEDTEYVYLFGPADMAQRMFADGKVGDTRNRAQRRKALRAGDLKLDFRAVRPCENGVQCAATVLEYLCRQGAQRLGNDHFTNAPGSAIAHVIATLEAMDFVTPDSLRARLYLREAA